ncbi:hypothetical protein F5Y13DRAFT_158602 [Hypoxylon sp. FL1857]|nr:hypothetical protein F5Y13DRAFT_158602 [Hypoxylon sp. FL1857]
MSTAEKSITTYSSNETNTAIRTITQVTEDSNIQATTKEQRYQFLRSLRFPAMNERRNNLIDSHEKTFRWVFGTDDCDVDYTPWDNFSDWLKSDCGIYWISGKPGSGKSTLIKYIIESPLTKSALDIWRAGPKILSHFFWKPGSKMQNNIKGLLCSILHQVFLFDTNILDSTLATISSLLVKESDTDWSIKELKALCFTVLDSYPSPLCIFLDGLDEVCEEDGPLALLKLVNDLSTLANIKICVASRSEPLLRSALCRYQQLRLQDLTRDDMRKYADAQISPYVTQHRISRKDARSITHSLVDKAEGVFLWLYLAARSLVRGLENGDTTEEVRQRLDEMPNELSKLYSDMWTRMNGDTRLYRENAAWYFNLMIASQSMEALLHQSGMRGKHVLTTVFHFMATIEHSVQDVFINKRSTMDAASLQLLCNKTRNTVQVRCAGLLEISETEPRHKELSLWNPADYEDILPYGKMKIQFIHRTAYDFLTDTEEGHRIRAYDSSSSDALNIQLVKGDLVMARLFRSSKGNDVHRVLRPLSWVADPSLQAGIFKLLRGIWYWYDNKYYVVRDVWLYKSPVFLAVATSPAFRHFILSSIAEDPNPSSLATDVLRDMFDNSFRRFDRKGGIKALSCFVRPLLSLDADPTSKGVVSREHLGPRSRSLVPFLSPFGSFISNIFTDTSPNEKIVAKYKSLQTFMDTQVDLEERIPLLIRIRSPHRSRLDRQPHLYIHDMDHYDFPIIGPLDYHENHVEQFVVLDLKATLLVEAFYERARKQGILKESSAYFPNRTYDMNLQEGTSSSDSPAHVALVMFTNQDDVPGYGADRYKPTDGRITGQLLTLLIEFLCGDESEILAVKVRKWMTDIYKDIRNGSTGYEKVRNPAREYLAEKKCGYHFVNEAGEAGETGEGGDDNNDHKDD